MTLLRRIDFSPWLALALLVGSSGGHAFAQAVAEIAADQAEVLAADGVRIEAMTTADRPLLEEILDDDLHYAHSNGVVDTKDSLIDLITSGRTTYVAYEPAERHVSFPVEGIAIVSGRAAIVVRNQQGRNEFTVSYLAVWRRAIDGWKFLAWQSARLPPATP